MLSSMGQSVHAILDDALFRRARLESERQRKRMEDIVKEALQRYLDQQESLPSKGGVVAASWGALRFDKEAVRDLLENEPDFLDA